MTKTYSLKKIDIIAPGAIGEERIQLYAEYLASKITHRRVIAYPAKLKCFKGAQFVYELEDYRGEEYTVYIDFATLRGYAENEIYFEIA